MKQKKESIFIPILSDYGFKVTFANEKNTLFLLRAIQALIQSPVPIQKVELARNEFAGITKLSRGGLYDLICTDEDKYIFIVEMQLGEYKQFVNRSKFYAFQSYNTLVIKGQYQFEHLPKIYCIGFLAKNIFPHSDYYHFCQLKNQHGEIIDEQMLYIVIEIAKFTKEKQEIKTDLDKLIYTMKHIHEVEKPIEFPDFWNEEWIQIAIEQLSKSNFTPEQRAQYEMMIAHNASVFYMFEEEKKQAIKEAVEKAEKKAEKKALEQRISSIKKLLITGKFEHKQIAELLNVSIEKVLEIQKSMISKK